ncbi:TonB dependent receptor [compost metagenome]
MLGVDPISGIYQFDDGSGNAVFDPDQTRSKSFLARVNTSPKYFGGLQNTISFKGLSLDIFMQFVKQNGRNYLYSFDSFPGRLVNGLGNQPIESFERWKQIGDKSKIQRFSNGQLFDSYNYASQSDAAYSDASFVRLKNVSLSYNLPNQWTRKLHLHTLQVFILGQNLLTITEYKGLDPESQSVTALPPLRMITTGIKLKL